MVSKNKMILSMFMFMLSNNAMLTGKMVGEKIAAARKQLNISQAQLAQQLFISPQAVGKWERGESVPDLITFHRLARVLGVDLNYFSGDFPTRHDEKEAAPASETEPSPAGKRNWDMSAGNWVGADFSGLKNLHEKFASSNLQNCLFACSDLSGLELKGNNVERCDFSDSDLSHSNMQECHVANNVFQNCLYREAGFFKSHIESCDFSGADFTGATFRLCSCVKNTMTNAVLFRTSFIGSDILDVVFNGTLEDCYFENCAFKRVTFENATLINTFFKTGSLKRVRLVNCQADKITYEFLKNGKADVSSVKVLGAG